MLLSQTFTVINTLDDTNPGSLRYAIEQVNADTTDTAAAPDTIAFAIPGAGVHTIAPATDLPAVTSPVIIDGYTQPGASANTLANGDNAVPLIELNALGYGLNIIAGNSTVRGLVIDLSYSVPNSACLRLGENGGNTISGNFIGTDATGTTALTSYYNTDGISVDGSPDNIIGGTTPGSRNVIYGNGTAVAIRNSGAVGNVVQGNLINTDVTGTEDIAPNTNVTPVVINGVLIDGASSNTIGGTAAGSRNIISGNTDGVFITHSGTSGNLVQGNFIGTDVTGTKVLGMLGNCVSIDGAPNNTIGGTTGGAGNVLAGVSVGIRIDNSGATGNLIEGNFMGTDVTGTKALDGGNVTIDGATHNTIGGATAGARNLISGSFYSIILESGASGNLIEGDFMGTDVTGTQALPGGGVDIDRSANNTIGGAAAGARNLISGGASGIQIGGSGATGNLVQGNFIGTDVTGTKVLGGDGVTIGGEGASGNTIGGTAAGAGNVIGGMGTGILLRSDGADTVIQGNFIGTDVTGTKNLGCTDDGIFSLSSGDTIGGTVIGAGNTIAFNSGSGVDYGGGNDTALIGNTIAHNGSDSNGGSGGVLIVQGTGHSILSNSIFDNGRRGIANTQNSFENYPGGSTTGPNDLENFPVLTSITPSEAGTTIQGRFNSRPNGTYRIEFFSNDALDASDVAEGQTYLGFTNVTTDAAGNTTFSFSTAATAVQFVTMTATSMTSDQGSNNTSLFSPFTTMVVSSSVPTSVVGEAVTFAAMLSSHPLGEAVSGTVIFTIDGVAQAPARIGSHGASFTTSALPVGTHTVSAVYSGDDTFPGSSGALSPDQAVNPSDTSMGTSVTLTSSSDPSTVGQEVAFTATVSPAAGSTGTPTGTVTFEEGTTTLQAVRLDTTGHATFTTAALGVGRQSITAVYSGDANFAASDGTTVQSVQAASQVTTTTVVAASPNPSTVGESVTFIATVTQAAVSTGMPTGTVTFEEGTTILQAVPLDTSGHASFTTMALGVGPHTITAVYGGDANFATSSGTTAQAVQAVQTASQVTTTTVVAASPNPSLEGQPTIFTATVTRAAGSGGTLTGTVTFQEGTTLLQAVPLDTTGHATFTTAALGAGGHTITANYGGDAKFAASVGTTSQAVNVVAGQAPSVVKLQRFGFHMHPTVLVLTFNQPLAPTTAQDARNYRIVGPGGHPIEIRRAVYDPANMTVTLHPTDRLSVHHPYRVSVIGTGSNGVSNTSGRPLDSDGNGQPGADDHLELTGRGLVLGHVSRRFLIRNHLTPPRGRRGRSRSGSAGRRRWRAPSAPWPGWCGRARWRRAPSNGPSRCASPTAHHAAVGRQPFTSPPDGWGAPPFCPGSRTAPRASGCSRRSPSWSCVRAAPR